jgi:molecular chaperone DnaK
MALQLSFRRGLTSFKASKGSVGTSFLDLSRRYKSTDVGDVIGIDLGTTNSCVAVMVRFSSPFVPYHLYVGDA